MKRVALLSLILASGVIPNPSALSSDWPHYGGPNHNGQITDAKVAPDGKNMKVLWKAHMLAPGHSGAAVVDNQVFIIDRKSNGDDAEDVLRTLDLQTGEELWSFSHPAPGLTKYHAFGNMPWRGGPVSVPAVGATRVFFSGTKGRLYCVDRISRKEIWSAQQPLAKGGAGCDVHSPSPLLVGEHVIVSYSGKGGDWLRAYRVSDGSVAWTVQPTIEPKKALSVVHASPILAEIFGQNQVVATHKLVTFGADPKTGSILWQYEGYQRGTIQAEAAVSPDGYMFFTSGHDGASALTRMIKDGSGYRFEDIYNDPSRDRGKTRACSEWRPGHWVGEHLYHVSNHYAAHGLLCMDKQGRVLWKTRTKDKSKRGPDFRYSCLTIVNGVGLAMNGGMLHVIDLNPKAYKELGAIRVFTIDEIKVGERPEVMRDRAWASYPRRLAFSTWAKHAYSDGLFVTRNAQWLACVRVAPSAEGKQ